MNAKQIIFNTIIFVKKELQYAEGGHDWFHIERVYKNALLILEVEKANSTVVKLAALLHDIADSKFYDGDESIGPKKAKMFLEKENVKPVTIKHVIQIIKNISYRKSLDNAPLFNSKEFQIVQDADRLDAIGAIGIARAFNYGGFKNRQLYNPKIKPQINQNKETYKKSKAPTINHFYEKLLLLKDKMNTETGKLIAKKRHQFMQDYLTQFYDEWNGKK
ncbi:MAG: HD domain-containing protein [Flavobacteriaceae bacterium]|nr:HD domain-containing protein [Flavobacteriaceae bacterium]